MPSMVVANSPSTMPSARLPTACPGARGPVGPGGTWQPVWPRLRASPLQAAITCRGVSGVCSDQRLQSVAAPFCDT